MIELINNISCLQRNPCFSGTGTQNGYSEIKCSDNTENSLPILSEKT
jgi:hypothetical protein